MKQIRVLFITDLLWKMGGAERSLILLARKWRDNGKSITICYLQGGPLADSLREEGFDVIGLNLKKVFSLKGIAALLQLIQIIKRKKISIVISYHESSDYIGVLAGTVTGVPVVSSRRDMGFKLRRRHLWFYRFLNPLFDHTVAVANSVKNKIIQTQWISRNKIDVIYNGVDPDLINQIRLPESESILSHFRDSSQIKICCLANIRRIKGLHHLVDAAGLIVRKIPNVKFILIGNCEAEPEYYQTLVEQVKEKKLEKNVVFTGEVKPVETAGLLSLADISVLPSLSEGFSNTILESMAVGLPVVATSVGGTPEIVKNEKTGLLVPPGDSEALSEALTKLLKNRDLRQKMGRNARDVVRNCFSLAEMVEKYDDIIVYVIQKRKNKLQYIKWWLNKYWTKYKWVNRVTIANIFYWTGINYLFKRLRCLIGKGRVIILSFHDICEGSYKACDFSIRLPEYLFRKQLNFLVKHYPVISLKEACDLLLSNKPLYQDFVALTFDDSYKSFFKRVRPICAEMKVPYAVFVCTSPLDENLPLFYDILILFVENTCRKTVDLSELGFEKYLLDTPNARFHFVEDIMKRLKSMTSDEYEKNIRKLTNFFISFIPSENLVENLLDWEELLKIDKTGATIGAHSHSHLVMTKLKKNKLEQEVSINRTKL